MEASIEQGVAWQIKLNRTARGITQRQLADALNTQQSAISRLEDPTHGAHNLETLMNIAKVFDCALSVKLVSYSQLAYDSDKLSEEDQVAATYEAELKELNEHQTQQHHPESPTKRTGANHLRRPTGEHADRTLRHKTYVGRLGG